MTVSFPHDFFYSYKMNIRVEKTFETYLIYI